MSLSTRFNHLSSFLSDLVLSDGFALRILYLFEDFLGIDRSGPYQKKDEQIGFLTFFYIVLAALSAAFSLRGAVGNLELFILWVTYILFLTLGASVAALMGVEGDPAKLIGELMAVVVGLLGFSIIVFIQFGALISKGILMFSSINGSLAVLAPVSETLLFTVVLYRMIRLIAPSMHWIIANVFSTVWFVAFHYFAYGVDTLSIFILLAGNTVFNYTYELTRNPAAPMTCHLMANLIPYWGDLLEILQSMWWLFVLPFVFIIAFVIVGGLRK